MAEQSAPEERSLPKMTSFYVDDSSCVIGDISHTLLGAISFEDETHALASFIEIKQKLGIRPEEEIKWNSSQFTSEQRNFISRQVLPVLSKTHGFLIISEHAKESAVLQLAIQLSDFCRANGFSGFILRLDDDIVQNRSEFDQHVYHLTPSCFGWSSVHRIYDGLAQVIPDYFPRDCFGLLMPSTRNRKT